MLNVRNLSAAYGQSRVLHDIDLSVNSGEIVALVGRNGMGKSTLMKTMIGVMPMLTGQIMLDGTDMTPLLSHERVGRGLGYVPQGRQIFGTMTVKENIETGLVVTGKSDIPAEIFDLFPILRGIRHTAAAVTCPAVSNSNWRSPGRSPVIPRSCCSTSPPRESNLPSSRILRGCCATFAASATFASWFVSSC